MFAHTSLTCLVQLFAAIGSAIAIWPIPHTITTGQEILLLSRDFAITAELSTAPKDLIDAIDRTKTRLFNDNLGRLVVGRGSSDSVAFNSSKTLQSLRLRLLQGDRSEKQIKSIFAEAIRPLDRRDESYTLNIPVGGNDATLGAASTLGLLRGLTTFEQLWYTFSGQVYAVDMPLHIEDAPAFSYRGFSLDTSRNFWVKMNTLYWHVVDSHSFPLEVREFPELAQMGAYSMDRVYSEEDVKDIINYAAGRGIDVVLELDTPGHETAVGLSHPEHVACYLATPWAEFANEPPAGQLRLASPATINFSIELVSSVSSKFKSTLFSTGGDEVNTNCYEHDAQTQEDLKDTGLSLDEALDNFLRATHGVIRSQGKTPIVKEDMILRHNTTLPNSTIAVVWISSQDAKNVTSRGYRVIHQPSDYFYLDCGGGGWLGNDIPGNSWCDPFKTWQKIYAFDPLANLTETESSLVLGGLSICVTLTGTYPDKRSSLINACSVPDKGQIPLWSEQSSPENLDSIIWPRAASAAEVFWSGGKSNGAALNVSFALPRLHDVRFRMVERGVKAIPLQPEWCAVRAGACDIDS